MKYLYNDHLQCWQNLKLGQITNTITHGKYWWVLLQMLRCPLFQTCGGGRVSDKQITRGSGVLNLLEPGDNVMVDRGFDISDIVSNGVIVNMPPFLAGRDQMTGVETQETMSIASLRMPVERAIGRIKTYHMLDGTLPNTLSSYALQIVKVCALLTNFLPHY